jgi:hypothetical protein
MSVRELLQKELWSKETSRRIIVVLLTLTAVVVLLSYGSGLISRDWLTPEEQKAARESLAIIDSLHSQDLINENDPDVMRGKYVVYHEMVEARVKQAESVARTRRDRLVTSDLVFCELAHEINLFDALKQRMPQRESSTVGVAKQKTQERMNAIKNETRSACADLQSELDQQTFRF